MRSSGQSVKLWLEIPTQHRLRESRHAAWMMDSLDGRRAADGMYLSWRWNDDMISTVLDVIWEMSDNIGSSDGRH